MHNYLSMVAITVDLLRRVSSGWLFHHLRTELLTFEFTAHSEPSTMRAWYQRWKRSRSIRTALRRLSSLAKYVPLLVLTMPHALTSPCHLLLSTRFAPTSRSFIFKTT